MDERRPLVVKYHKQGWSVQEIARLCQVSRPTIYSDFEALGLENFSSISDAQLKVVIHEIMKSSYPCMGRRFLNGALVSRGLRIQRCRILRMKRELPHLFGRPRRIRRLKYNVNPGPYWCLHMDQSEHMVGFYIYVLTAIDGFCRYAPYHQVVTDLKGSTHSKFFANYLASNKILPAHVCVDGTSCWNGVRHVMDICYRNQPPVTPVTIEYDNHDDVQILIHRFQVVSSVHNTAVEIHWRWINHIADEYLDCFFLLEAQQLLHGGRHADMLDIYCLHYVFLPYIKADLADFYATLEYRPREMRSRNPHTPKGTWRPVQLREYFPHHGIELETADVENLASLLESYEWGEDGDPRADEFTSITDPLQTPIQRYLRESLMTEKYPIPHRPLYRDFDILSDMYVYLRKITHRILQVT